MDNETEVSTEQYDSLPTDEYQSSDVVQSENERRLQAENDELRSRLGAMAQKHGQEKKQLEGEYAQWGANLQAYYEAQLDNAKKTIARLEDRYLEQGDAEGAKVVLEERRAREREEEQAREARATQERLRREEIQDAIEKAVRNFDGITAEDLVGAATPDQVWAQASRIYKERTEASYSRRVDEERRLQQPPQIVEETRVDEINEQEQYSRVPSTPRGVQVPAATSRRLQELEARRNELRKALDETKRNNRNRTALANAFALRGELTSIERQIAQLS